MENEVQKAMMAAAAVGLNLTEEQVRAILDLIYSGGDSVVLATANPFDNLAWAIAKPILKQFEAKLIAILTKK